MGGLPRRLLFRAGGRSFAVVHGAPSAINGFVFPSTAAATVAAEIASAGTAGVICGHSGIPFVRRSGEAPAGGGLWLNAGAIGMPANDGTPRVWYATLEPQPPDLGGGLRAAIHALDYDHAAAARKMRDRRLPEGYASALETGLWPSCDVLPPVERAARGRPLSPVAVVWPRPSPDKAEPKAILDKDKPEPRIAAKRIPAAARS